jgi:hypothetical protein
MVTVAGEIPRTLESPLLRLTVTPPLGAAVVRVMGNAIVRPSPTDTLGTVMDPMFATVTAMAPEATLGDGVLAVIVALPDATPCRATLVVVRPPEITTRDGTVTAPVLLDKRFTGRPPVGAGAERFKETLRVPPAPTETV